MTEKQQSEPAQMTLPTVTNVEIYSSLEREDLHSGKNSMNTSQKKSWLADFTQEHLPANRLRSNEDDMSNKFLSTSTSRRYKKRHSKQKIKVSRSIHAKLNHTQRKLAKDLITSQNQKYSTYIPLRRLWTSYIQDLMSVDMSKVTAPVFMTLAQKMMKADLHGCPLTVRRSKCPGYVGVEGIVIQETRNMFTLICQDDKVRCIPKANSVFTTVLQNVVFTIHGNQFLVRPGERAAKKFKAKSTIDL
ncbi:ribonuclease p protein subunit p29-like [Plakobranchus ocellatus]|uniref:Ribonuclease P protein subunit p29 n=1 Tax=Plakobranchus ocellatus TaxID=259542 RepID=A0AAV4C1D2_9GAST|nr:ribonuclease p protein subunit p29-like [Plakobranchus ocellatus]